MAIGDNTDLMGCMLEAGSGTVSVDDCAAGLKEATDDVLSYTPEQETQLAELKNKSLLSLMFEDREMSFVGLVKTRLAELKIIPEAKAQSEGFGYTQLEFIRPMWKGVRNASYFLFVLVTIIMAFMIMFRVKISPQIVISVQSALPKIATAIVLVTFSYAIAGLMIDLIYVIIGIISMIATQMGLFPSTGLAYIFISGSLPGGIIFYFITYLFLFALGLYGSLFVSVPIFMAIPLSIIYMLVAFLAFVILIFVFIWQMLKVFWMLVKTLAQIYILIIVGPLQITLGTVIPGMGIGSWLKSLFANLAVFPAVGAMLALTHMFVVNGYLAMINTHLDNVGVDALAVIINEIFGTSWNPVKVVWSPPFLGGAGGSLVSLMFIIMSLAIMMMISKIADIIKATVAGQPFAYGTAIGQSLTEVPKAAWNMDTTKAVREILTRRRAKRTLTSAGTALEATGSEKLGNLGQELKSAGEESVKGSRT